MNKILSSIIGLILIISLSIGVSATVDVTYNYNQNNVQIKAYNCADSLCRQVKTFGGSLVNGQTTTQGKLAVSYPAQLQDFGYALFHFSQGYLPKVTRTDFNGNGALTENIQFSKAGVCRSTIDSFTVTNDAKTNVPLAISVEASLDSSTKSAFTFTQNTVEFVPQDKINDYYSTDVRVRLTIKKPSGETIDQQTQDFTSAKGNPIKADDSKRVEFNWTPSQDGKYAITVETEVIDDQCTSTEKQSTSKEINVLQGMPRNQCYSILNGLKSQSDLIRIQDNVAVEFTSISNYANNFASTDQNYKLTPIQTQVQYIVTGPNGETVHSETTTLNSNSDETTPKTQTFNWATTKTGEHIITVTGTPVGTQCSGLSNIGDVISLKLFVSTKPKYSLKIILIDAQTGSKVENANVKLTWPGNEYNQSSNSNGEALFNQLEPRAYNYEITNKDYQTLTGAVSVINADQTITLILQRIILTQNKFKVEIQTIDSNTNLPVSGSTVMLNGFSKKTTDSNGKTSFIDLANGDYDFEIIHKNYETSKGRIKVNNADLTAIVKLTRTTTKTKNHEMFINSINMPNAFELNQGDQLEIIIDLENSGTKSIEDVKVTATIQELGLRASSGPLNKLSVGDSTTRKLLLTIPEDTEKGIYYVRITINNDKNAESQRTVYREIEVV